MTAIAVDFGTSNTVVAVWDAAEEAGVPLHLDGFGRFMQQNGRNFSVVPSLIHYGNDTWIGNQVLQRNLYDSPRTFRWMKRYIALRSPQKKRLDGRLIDNATAGRDFIHAVLARVGEDYDVAQQEVIFTVPVESFEDYEAWLGDVAQDAGLFRYRLIDEASAAALGYGAQIQENEVYLVFDFGGGTLDVAVVLMEEGDRGRRCRVLGKQGASIGGMTIDQWLFEEVLRRTDSTTDDDRVQRLGNALLVECEAAKERLSTSERAEIGVVDYMTGAVLGTTFTRREFEQLLEEHDFYATLDQTIRRALQRAQERGFTADDVQAVLLVGGSSQIPSVRQMVQRIFGRKRVHLHHPIDAVARGAAAYAAGIDLFDHIQHDYTLRYRDRRTGDYAYRTIIKHGTAYPTDGNVTQLTIKSTYPGQTHLGLAIFEVSDAFLGGDVDLVFDQSGAASLQAVSADVQQDRRYFWMNAGNQTFLEGQAAKDAGELCYRLSFRVDDQKRLLITAFDLRTKRSVYENYPVLKLR